MKNIDLLKIFQKEILFNQQQENNLSPSLNNVYDAMIKIFPNIVKYEKLRFNCLREQIIKCLKQLHTKELFFDKFAQTLMFLIYQNCSEI